MEVRKILPSSPPDHMHHMSFQEEMLKKLTYSEDQEPFPEVIFASSEEHQWVTVWVLLVCCITIMWLCLCPMEKGGTLRAGRNSCVETEGTQTKAMQVCANVVTQAEVAVEVQSNVNTNRGLQTQQLIFSSSLRVFAAYSMCVLFYTYIHILKCTPFTHVLKCTPFTYVPNCKSHFMHYQFYFHVNCIYILL